METATDRLAQPWPEPAGLRAGRIDHVWSASAAHSPRRPGANVTARVKAARRNRTQAPMNVGPEITAAVQHVIRNAGFHVGTMPLVDMRNGGHDHVLDAGQGRPVP